MFWVKKKLILDKKFPVCQQSKQREDRTDLEEASDASLHVRHSVAIPYPVPQKNLSVQVTDYSLLLRINWFDRRDSTRQFSQ